MIVSQINIYSGELEKDIYGDIKGIFIIAPHFVEEKNLRQTEKVKYVGSITWYRVIKWLREYLMSGNQSEIFQTLAIQFTEFLKERQIIMTENFNIVEMSAASNVIPLLKKCWGVLENVHDYIQNELNLGKSLKSFGPWINEGRQAKDPRFAVYGEALGSPYYLRVFAGFFFDRKDYSHQNSVLERDDIVPTLRVMVHFKPGFEEKFTPLIDACHAFQEINDEWVIRKGDWHFLTVERLMTSFLDLEEQQLEMIKYFKDKLDQIKSSDIGKGQTLLNFIGKNGVVSKS